MHRLYRNHNIIPLEEGGGGGDFFELFRLRGKYNFCSKILTLKGVG